MPLLMAQFALVTLSSLATSRGTACPLPAPIAGGVEAAIGVSGSPMPVGDQIATSVRSSLPSLT
jgi:hypothetical protein